MKILIIDDNHSSIVDTYILACNIIFGSNNVEYFMQPEQAEEFLKKNFNEVDIIILDIMFTGDGEHKGGFYRGIDAYNEFKNKYSKIPIIILTQMERNDLPIEFLTKIEVNQDLFQEKVSTSPEQLLNQIKIKLNYGN